MEGTNRRVSKPLMEKRRRARINQSLAELKSLIMEDIKTESPRHSKLEKADILEMAVKHLKELHKQKRISSLLTRETVRNKFRAGYEECLNEIENFFTSNEAPSSTTNLNRDLKNNSEYTKTMDNTRQRILKYLGEKLDQLTIVKKNKNSDTITTDNASATDRDGNSSPFPDRPGTADSPSSRSCFCSRVGSLRLLLVPSEYGNGECDVIGVSSTNELGIEGSKGHGNNTCTDKQSPRPESSMSGNSAGFSSQVSSSSQSADENSSSDECERRELSVIQGYRERETSTVYCDVEDVEMREIPPMYVDPLWRPW